MKRCGMNCIFDSDTCDASAAGCGTKSYSQFCNNSFCANNCDQDPEEPEEPEETCESRGLMDCDGVCYDPATHHCIDDTVCLKTKLPCGGMCFDPSTHDCHRGTICLGTYDDACSGTCFKFSDHTCIDCKLCGLDDDALCGGTCYDNATHSCPDGSHLCPLPDDAYNNCALCFEEYAGNIGASCYNNNQCHANLKCSGTNAFPVSCSRGHCMCDDDVDCSNTEWCHKGFLGIGVNECRPKKPNSDSCTRRAQCISDRCYWGNCKACSSSGQCASGKTCSGGVCS